MTVNVWTGSILTEILSIPDDSLDMTIMTTTAGTVYGDGSTQSP